MTHADNVRAAADSMAQALSQRARPAWLNYAAAQAEREKAQDERHTDLRRSVVTLREEINVVVDGAVRHALESTELHVHGLGALVDTVEALARRVDAIAAHIGIAPIVEDNT